MQKYKKFSTQILSMALMVVMVTTMTPSTVFATESMGQPDCTCELKCMVADGENYINTDCLLCGMETADLQQCEGLAPALLTSGDIIVDGTGNYTLNKAGLEKAFLDVADNGTIQLAADIDLGADSVSLGNNFAKTVKLDLNGKTLTSAIADKSDSVILIGAGSTGSLYITDQQAKAGGTKGTISQMGGIEASTSTLKFYSTGTLSVEHVKIISNTNSFAIQSNNGGTLKILEGSEIESSGMSTIDCEKNTSNMPFEMSGGYR